MLYAHAHPHQKTKHQRQRQRHLHRHLFTLRFFVLIHFLISSRSQHERDIQRAKRAPRYDVTHHYS